MKILSFLIILMWISPIVFCQTNDSCYAGVYLTKEDFLTNRLSYRINEGVKGNKFEFSIPADLTLTIKIVKQDSMIRFKPGVIYGYFECGGAFRYFQGIELNVQKDYYKIEEPRGLIIYSSVFIAGSEFFYSMSLTSPIHRLKIENLEKDFNDHPDFIDSIKKYIYKPDGGIAVRDDKGFFVVNNIYRDTIGEYK